MPLLEIQNLSVEYKRGRSVIPAVRDVSFSLEEGETLGLVGESGCGKSTVALSILRLLSPTEARISSGKIIFQGEDLLVCSTEKLGKIRARIGIVFQDPFSSLNPVFTVGNQMIETLRWHGSKNPGHESRELLFKVQLTDAERILSSYPHQLSGGQRQRVMIALAVCANPKLLIADEPTTALDVTVQQEIMNLLANLQKELHMSLILVTHNLAIISHNTHRCAVMYAGELAEEGLTSEVISRPFHPYTQALLRCIPTLETGRPPKPLSGQPPDPWTLPSGCPFHPRCDQVLPHCPHEVPALRPAEDRIVRCHLYPPPPTSGYGGASPP